MPVEIDPPVVSVGECKSAQPIELKRAAPFWMEIVDGAGVAGADRGMNPAKLTISDDISEAVPIVVPKFGLRFSKANA
jgi:hypothetical protein